jgi:NTE family protein
MNIMGPPRAKPLRHDVAAITQRYDRVALVLQGGGALGAYQVGVYQALAEAGCEPNWISGVSIGAINSAIIAGNPPAKRLQNLETFWTTVSGRKIWSYTPEGDIFRDWRNQTSSLMTMLFEQPGFFQPRVPNPWLNLPGAHGATSYYDSKILRDTLERPIERWPKAVQRRRRQCTHWQLHLFRLRKAKDWPGAYHGLWRSSASAPLRQD